MKKLFFALILLGLALPVYLAYRSNVVPLFVKTRIQQYRPLVMGVIPYLQPEKLKQHISPVMDYLSLKLQRKIKLMTASDYEGLGRLLELKRIDLAWFSDTSYRKLKRNNEWEIICRPVQYGSVVYRGQIIVRKNSGIKDLADLAGKTFAYVDRYSGSGFYYPNLLFKRKGIKPLDFFGRVEFSQSHRASIMGVIDGIYDAAAVFSANLLDSDLDRHSEENNLRVIAVTDPIPNDPLVVRKDFDAGLKSKVALAMLNMHKDEKGSEFLAILRHLRGTERFISEEEVQKIIQAEMLETVKSNKEDN
ncbi:MAG: hypothetical protein Kow0029_02970 [Candidatus Rifleibacteriota bacterium]